MDPETSPPGWKFSGSLFTDTGMLKRTQWIQFPEGASGSLHIKANERVPWGIPDQEISGEILDPLQVYLAGISPSGLKTFAANNHSFSGSGSTGLSGCDAECPYDEQDQQ